MKYTRKLLQLADVYIFNNFKILTFNLSWSSYIIVVFHFFKLILDPKTLMIAINSRILYKTGNKKLLLVVVR